MYYIEVISVVSPKTNACTSWRFLNNNILKLQTKSDYTSKYNQVVI